MVNPGIELILIALALANLSLAGMSRLVTCIRVVALQGVLLGLLTVALRFDALTTNDVALALGSAVLKGLVFPWLLLRAVREIDVRREVEPFIGYMTSIAIGAMALPVAVWLGSRLPERVPDISPLLAPVALHAILIGLLLIVSRRKALTQVLGYLVMENGIFVFGVGMVRDETMLVEMGVLLDVFVAVFVMGITIFRIGREFDHIEADRLSTLKD